MKRLIKVYLTAETRVFIERRVENTVRSGRAHSRTIRTEKRSIHCVDVEIDARPGITHTLERQRVRDALRARANRGTFFSYQANDPAQFDTLKRRSDGSYIL